MRAWNELGKSRLLRRKQTISEWRRWMRRAWAFGRKPNRWIAIVTRSRVAWLTSAPPFRTRETVPIPTPAARATSRMVAARSGGVMFLPYGLKSPDLYQIERVAERFFPFFKSCGGQILSWISWFTSESISLTCEDQCPSTGG